MKCHYCGGEMKKGKSTYTLNKNGYHLLIDQIPAWICSQCGEIYFKGKEVDTIQEVVKSIDSGVEKLREEKAAA